MKTKPNAITIRYAKCAWCSKKTETMKLYLVLNKKTCLECGNKEIETWNAWVKEAEATTWR